MIRLSFTIELNYEVAESPADFIFNLHAARTAWQTVVSESFVVTPSLEHVVHTGDALGNRYARLRAGPGPVAVRYEATVDINHHRESPALLQEVPIAEVAPDALAFIYPSRYCQADLVQRRAWDQFGHLPRGYAQVQAVRDWVGERIRFQVGASAPSTSALDTLNDLAGVCRDFAHAMIALCRALNYPARFVTGVDYGADPGLGPPDFHAYVEVFVGGAWYLFDPTGISPVTGLIRIGTGRDAADVSFATIFGPVRTGMPRIAFEAVDDPLAGLIPPVRTDLAVSTAD